MARKPALKQRKLVVGITGAFGSGKSTVARLLASGSRAAEIIDADAIAHGLLKPGSMEYKAVVSVFGKGILEQGKAAIDRGKLAHEVFRSRRQLTLLNAILHPAIIRKINNRVKASSKRMLILDAPLLIETGLHRIADTLVVVKAREPVRFKRLSARMKLAKSEVRQRQRAQYPLAKKLRMADFIIDNDGSLSKTKKQVRQIRRLLWKSSTSVA